MARAWCAHGRVPWVVQRDAAPRPTLHCLQRCAAQQWHRAKQGHSTCSQAVSRQLPARGLSASHLGVSAGIVRHHQRVSHVLGVLVKQVQRAGQKHLRRQRQRYQHQQHLQHLHAAPALAAHHQSHDRHKQPACCHACRHELDLAARSTQSSSSTVHTTRPELATHAAGMHAGGSPLRRQTPPAPAGQAAGGGWPGSPAGCS